MVQKAEVYRKGRIVAQPAAGMGKPWRAEQIVLPRQGDTTIIGRRADITDFQNCLACMVGLCGELNGYYDT